MKTNLVVLLLTLVMVFSFLGCSSKTEDETGKVWRNYSWAGYLDNAEQNSFADILYNKPTNIFELIKLTEYKYRVGDISNRPVPKEEAIELTRLEIAAIAISESNLSKKYQLRLFELRHFYAKYSTLSRKEAKEIASLELKQGISGMVLNPGTLPEKERDRLRELLIKADYGSRTAE